MSRLCQSCVELISEKRLKAVPNAVLCIDCKTMNDEKVCREPRTDMGRLFIASSVTESGVVNRKLKLSTGGLSSVVIHTPDNNIGRPRNEFATA